MFELIIKLTVKWTKGRLREIIFNQLTHLIACCYFGNTVRFNASIKMVTVYRAPHCFCQFLSVLGILYGILVSENQITLAWLQADSCTFLCRDDGGMSSGARRSSASGGGSTPWRPWPPTCRRTSSWSWPSPAASSITSLRTIAPFKTVITTPNKGSLYFVMVFSSRGKHPIKVHWVDILRPLLDQCVLKWVKLP